METLFNILPTNTCVTLPLLATRFAIKTMVQGLVVEMHHRFLHVSLINVVFLLGKYLLTLAKKKGLFYKG